MPKQKKARISIIYYIYIILIYNICIYIYDALYSILLIYSILIPFLFAHH